MKIILQFEMVMKTYYMKQIGLKQNKICTSIHFNQTKNSHGHSHRRVLTSYHCEVYKILYPKHF